MAKFTCKVHSTIETTNVLQLAAVAFTRQWGPELAEKIACTYD
jgi:hypothetical protein